VPTGRLHLLLLLLRQDQRLLLPSETTKAPRWHL
jgi:hypothetical protein